MSLRKAKMNLFEVDATDVAERFKLRLLSANITHDLFVTPSGDVVIERAHDSHRKIPLPHEWMVGRYTCRSSVTDIEAELRYWLLCNVRQEAA